MATTKRTTGEAAAPPRKAADRRIPINLLLGLPDDRKAIFEVVDQGRRLDLVLRGTASLSANVSKHRFALNKLYFHASAPAPVGLGPGPLLNHVADPDICSGSLALIDKFVRSVERPCFNHPAAVARSGRDDVARLLAGTPGLDVPQTIRVTAATPKDMFEAIAKAGLKFPVLVRVPGSHGGLQMVRVAGPEDAREVFNLHSRSFYVTEFRDFGGSDGAYRKYRIAVIGREIYLRHVYIANSWLVHRERQIENPEKEGAAFLAEFDTLWAPRLRPMFLEIANRIDLDFFGVDCAIDPSGRVILFEANANMLIMKNGMPPPNIWDKPVARIVQAVENLMADPSRWRHRGSAKS